MTTSGRCNPRRSSSSTLSAASAGALSASDEARATPGGSAIRAPLLRKNDEQRGAISRAAGLTRSEAVVASIAFITTSTGTAAAAAAAGLLFQPHRAAAAETAAAAAVAPSEGAAAAAAVEVGTGDTSSPPEEVKYTVGSDEVGVLFGDGPIGIKLGDNPLKASGICRVYVTEVLSGSQAIRQANLKAGFGVAAVGGKPASKLEPKEVAELIRTAPRPMEIVFRDPEFLGRRLQAEAEKKAEAERLKKQQVADEKTAPAKPSSMTSPGELRVTQVGKKPTVCGTKTKAGDLIEFRYSARLANDLSVEFDSSDRRGTGLPYAIVLGNGDVLKGLDLSLFDMCVGERRKIEIPARLAYGRKGSKLFGIPPEDGLGSADVVFGVELVSINFRSDSSDQRDNFYTDDPCDAAAVAAGNSSGLCSKK
ncbi:unnamed protein product [Laminaria digitata]